MKERQISGENPILEFDFLLRMVEECDLPIVIFDDTSPLYY